MRFEHIFFFCNTKRQLKEGSARTIAFINGIGCLSVPVNQFEKKELADGLLDQLLHCSFGEHTLHISMCHVWFLGGTSVRSKRRTAQNGWTMMSMLGSEQQQEKKTINNINFCFFIERDSIWILVIVQPN